MLYSSNKKAALSEDSVDEIKILDNSGIAAVDFCIAIFKNDNFDGRDEAEKQEQNVDDLEKTFLANHIARLFDRQYDPLVGVVIL